MEPSPTELRARIVVLEEMVRRARHDVRSALAPAMLAADMMRGHADARVQGAGATVLRSIERVLDRLDATRELVPPRA
jgi:hypothetical protein